jgi:uncharacterized membrane protein
MPDQPKASATQVRQIQAEQRFLSGPLPPPEALEKYNQVLPGLAERIVALTERQSDHRQRLESLVVRSNARNELLGQVFALVLAAGTIGGSIWLVSLGKDIGGITGILTTIASLVGVFIYGRHKHRKELKEKQEALIGPLAKS